MISGEKENRNMLLYTNGKHINLSLTTFFDFHVTWKAQLPRIESHLLFTAFVGLIVTLLQSTVPKFQLSQHFFFIFSIRKQKRHKNVSHPTEIFSSPAGHFAPGCESNKDYVVPQTWFSRWWVLSLFVHFCYNWNRLEWRKETSLSFLFKISKFYFLENLLA